MKVTHSNNLGIYLSISTEAYDLNRPSPPADAYKFYRTYIAKAKGRIIEPMCGTGRFLLPLLQEGFDVCGFDVSSHMLGALNNKAKIAGLKPNVWQGFIEDFAQPERYDLIFIPSGSFSLIIDQDTIKTVIKILREHLTDNGILLFEAATYQSVPLLDRCCGSRWTRSDGKMIMLTQYAIFADNICSYIRKYELVANSKIIDTEVEELKFRLYQPKELTTLLMDGGFNHITTIKPFNKHMSPDEQDKTIVYECRK